MRGLKSVSGGKGRVKEPDQKRVRVNQYGQESELLQISW